MDHSIFMDKSQMPSNEDLGLALGDKFELWMEIRDAVLQQYPGGVEEWNFPGKKYGWSFRIKDKKRAIIYFLPREGEFLVAFVFGEKAMDAIRGTDISGEIVNDLENATVYAEGRGVRIPVHDQSDLEDIFRLIEIKMAY